MASSTNAPTIEWLARKMSEIAHETDTSADEAREMRSTILAWLRAHSAPEPVCACGHDGAAHDVEEGTGIERCCVGIEDRGSWERCPCTVFTPVADEYRVRVPRATGRGS